ncbi:MAG TPA: aldose 1-epimerase family protein [Nocardioidaceae bacterium]|nr:aldose 1-epimerase family protein [Nocardioidaceae bacterium]
MANIFGLPVDEVLPRVGALDQVARIDSLVDTDGLARGMRRLRVITGGGLEFDVLPDRGLDIGQAWFEGLPLAWVSSIGSAAPSFYEPEGRGFLRTFGGGLLATCGLDSFGPPVSDEDGVVGMHGRVGQIPTRLTRAESGREGTRIEGTVRQSAVFAENLVLRRQISAECGANSVLIDDTVTNEGANSSAHMVLYHFNLGWPLLDEGAEFEVPGASASPRDADAQAGLGHELDFGAPQPDFREQVFLYRNTRGIARLTNRTRGLRFTLRFSESLPALFEWKMTATQHYVVGVEPANTPVILGRRAARKAGQLPRLASGESVSYRLSVEVERI